MAKVSFSSLKLKVEEVKDTFKIADKVIEVKERISDEELNDMIQAVIERASTSTVYNDFAAACVFEVYFVMTHTNISFTETQKADLFKLHDILCTNGVVQAVYDMVGSAEVERTLTSYKSVRDEYVKYNYSSKGIVDQVLQFAPKSAGDLAQQLKDFDVEKYSNIMEMARGTGAEYARS